MLSLSERVSLVVFLLASLPLCESECVLDVETILRIRNVSCEAPRSLDECASEYRRILQLGA